MKHLSSNLLLVVFFLFVIISINGQNATIRGTIYEKENGEPTFGTNVKIKGSGIGASTDINGFYQINKLQPGKITNKVLYFNKSYFMN